MRGDHVVCRGARRSLFFSFLSTAPEPGAPPTTAHPLHRSKGAPAAVIPGQDAGQNLARFAPRGDDLEVQISVDAEVARRPLAAQPNETPGEAAPGLSHFGVINDIGATRGMRQ